MLENNLDDRGGAVETTDGVSPAVDPASTRSRHATAIGQQNPVAVRRRRCGTRSWSQNNAGALPAGGPPRAGSSSSCSVGQRGRYDDQAADGLVLTRAHPGAIPLAISTGPLAKGCDRRGFPTKEGYQLGKISREVLSSTPHEHSRELTTDWPGTGPPSLRLHLPLSE